MKLLTIAAVAILASIPAASASAADEQQSARAKYAELSAKVRAGDLDIDWQGLRVAAVLGEITDARDEFQATQKGYAALEQEKFADALKIAREIEEHNIADGDGHYIALVALDKLGRRDEQEKERIFLAAFFQSIIKSGDGKSAKTAWFAATIREEYLIMQLMLGVQFEQQHSLSKDGHYYDVVAVKDQNGKEQILWFNTDTDFQRMDLISKRFNQQKDVP